MSAMSDALRALRDMLRLADDVERVGETLRDVAVELRDHDRRITRMEARWETAMEFTAKRSRRRLPPPDEG